MFWFFRDVSRHLCDVLCWPCVCVCDINRSPRRMAELWAAVRRRLKVLEVLREAGRQYPLFRFGLLALVSLTVLFNR